MTVLPYVGDFIRSIHRDLSPGLPDDSTGLWLSRADEGSLSLSVAEVKEYTQIVSRLVDQFVKREDMSRRSVERYLQEALFAALNLQSRSTLPFEQRLDNAVAQLQARLTEGAASYTCYVPVGGLATEGLPCRLGTLRFVVLSKTQLRRLSRPDKQEPLTSDAVASRRQILSDLKGTDSWAKAAAVVNVQARDFDAAADLARRDTRRALDVLNFFSDLVPYSYGWVYLPTEAVPIKSGAPVQRADGTLRVSYSSEGPLQLFSLKSLRGLAILRPAFRRVHRLMRAESRSGLAAVLLASIQWAGRASVEPKREQAFLLFAIALETLVLPESDQQELTYRLRVRVAHLLGRDRSRRAALSSTIRDLYKIRSKIVHSGSYQVTDDDLGQLRSIVKRAILRVLLHRTIRQLRTAEELASWFEERVLQ